MNTSRSLWKFATLGALAISCVGIVLRTISLLCFFDADIGYYTTDAPLPIITNIVLIVSVLGSIVIGLLLLKKRKDGADLAMESPLSRIASVLSALALLAFAIFFVLDMRNAPEGGVGFPQVLGLIASLISILYFLMNLRPRNPHTQVLIGYFLIVFFVYTLAVSYFDPYIQMNAPEKVLLQMASLSAMVFLTAEFRAFFGTPRHGFYYASASVALILCGACAIPFLCASFVGILPYAWNSTHMLYRYVIFAFFLYVLSRMLIFGRIFASVSKENTLK